MSTRTEWRVVLKLASGDQPLFPEIQTEAGANELWEECKGEFVCPVVIQHRTVECSPWVDES